MIQPVDGGGQQLVRDGSKPYSWGGLPANSYEGSVEAIRAILPEFERHPFSHSSGGDNAYCDVILRRPLTDEKPVPVGIVSKQYSLLQHRDVLDHAVRVLGEAGISSQDVKVRLEMTGYGERIELNLILPEAFNLDPGDGHPIATRLIVFNSVDRSMRFRALVGAIRFICSNGMVIGKTKAELSKAHSRSLEIEQLSAVLQTGIKNVKEEASRYGRWYSQGVRPDAIESWVNGPLKEHWGVIASTRTFHIAGTGHDVELAVPFEKAVPSQKTIKQGPQVPGVQPPVRNAFAASQVLAWLASQRHDAEERLLRMSEVPDLVEALIKLG